MAAEICCSLKHLKLNKCFIHFDDVSQPLVKVTETRLNKFIACRERWAKLEGQKSEICRRSYELFTNEDVEKHFSRSNCCGELNWYYHQNCYKRICDENKLKKAEEKSTSGSEAAVEVAETDETGGAGEVAETVESVETIPPKKLLRRSLDYNGRQNSDVNARSPNVLPPICIICEKKSDLFIMKSGKRQRSPLVACETVDAGLLREAATKKKDNRVLKILDRDCVAIEVRYHMKCYKNYTNFLYRQDETCETNSTPLYNAGYEQFCVEVLEDLIKKKEITYMSRLYKKFVNIVQRVEGADASSFRKFRLKQRLMKSYPQLVFVTPSHRNVSEIVFTENLCAKDVVRDGGYADAGCDDNDDDDKDSQSQTKPILNELHILYHASMLLKEKLATVQGLQVPWPPLAADINDENVENIVEPSLFNFLAWTLGFSNDAQVSSYVAVTDKQNSRVKSLAQDMVLIASDGRKFTPKSLSLAMAMRQLTGSSKVIELLNQFGHCLSHNFVLRHETALAEMCISEKGTVPTGVSKNQNLTIAWDNDDFLEDTKTGRDTTHVTGGIVIQRDYGVITDESQPRESIARSSALKEVQDLIAPYVLGKKVTVNLTNALEGKDLSEKSHKQLQHAGRKLDFSFIITRLQPDIQLPNWTGYNTLLCKDKIPTLSRIVYLPIINASASEYSTINAILQRSTKLADEVGVRYVCLVFDEAIYSKIQQIRWKHDAYLDRFIVRLGEFHMAMAFCGAIAKLFGDGGLKDLLVEADLVAEGSVKGVLTGKHYNRSLRTHKVVYEAMMSILFRSFLESLPEQSQIEINNFNECMRASYPGRGFENYAHSTRLDAIVNDFNDYVKTKSSSNNTMAYWLLYIEMVQVLLLFIRATRENDWALHLSAVRSMLPWFFAADRVNYARYGSIYWLEMISLENSHPGATQGIVENWTCQRQTDHGFSSTPCDQVMEQTFNRDSKTKGGIVGFTLNRSAVQRWILAQPERGAISRECYALAGLKDERRSRKELDSSQIKFHNAEVAGVIETLTSMTNPFDDDLEDLVNISNGEIATLPVSDDLLKSHEIGERKFDEFLTQKVTSKEPDIFTTISKTNLNTFSRKRAKNQVTTKQGKIVDLQNDSKFISRLLTIGQSRQVNTKELMKYSLRKYPAPLATSDGRLTKTPKSKLMHELLHRGECTTVSSERTDVLLIDGMALLQTMKDIPQTFGSLAEKILRSIISSARMVNAKRVDFVCDTYPTVSIKNIERERRSLAGVTRIRIGSAKHKVPRQFKKFLSLGENKESLVEFIFQHLASLNLTEEIRDITVFFTHGRDCHEFYVDCTNTLKVKVVQALFSNQEEADTRLILHANHASSHHQTITIRSPDTDVFLVMLHHRTELSRSLIFDTGFGNNRKLIDIGEIYDQLGSQICKALAGFHAFTGCDSTSAFQGKGKLTCIQVLDRYPELLDSFANLGSCFTPSLNLQRALEVFVCRLYKQSDVDMVNEARFRLFNLGKYGCNQMPCTKDALDKHVQRAAYQAAIWHKALHPVVEYPDITHHGWLVDSGTNVSIDWMDLPSAPDGVLENVDCSCKTGCSSNRCSCFKANLACTGLCKCKDCTNRKSGSSENSESESESSGSESEGEDDME